jgi:hypothetical protein
MVARPFLTGFGVTMSQELLCQNNMKPMRKWKRMHAQLGKDVYTRLHHFCMFCTKKAH